jgi:hypothetical protein
MFLSYSYVKPYNESADLSKQNYLIVNIVKVERIATALASGGAY